MVRIKHRYLLLNFLYPEKSTKSRPRSDADSTVPWTVQFHRPSSDQLDAKLLNRMVRDGVADLFGDYGAGMIAGSFQVKYISPATSTAIVRVARAHYRMVWAALTFVNKIPRPVDQSCTVQVVRVSGTIKKAEEEAIRRARRTIVRAHAKDDTNDTSAFDEPSDRGMMSGIEDLNDEERNEEDTEDE